MSPEFERLGKGAADSDLREWIEWAQEELKGRDEKRKANAREAAQAVLSKAAAEARSILERAGLPFEPPRAHRVRKARPEYHVGHLYRHPDDGALRWNGRGVRPKWVRDLEAACRCPETE